MKNKLVSILTNKMTVVISAAVLVASGLILATGISGSKAELTYYSPTYGAHVDMKHIGVSLTEGDEIVASRDYIPNSNGQWAMTKGKLMENLSGNDYIQLGKTYEEVLGVTNSGSIGEYVRVKLNKYWTDQDGNKIPTLSPKLIDVEWDNIGTDWIKQESDNGETTTLYYTKLLPAGESTSAFTKSVTMYIDETIKYTMTETRVDNTIYYTYDYNGYHFCLEAEVDAVQQNNAEDAILSAWGVSATVTDGVLSLN